MVGESRVYMDTQVIDCVLRRQPEELLLFHSLKRTHKAVFMCSVDLLVEISVNPDVEAAKQSLRVVDTLCSRYLYVKEPKSLFKDELDSAREGMVRNPFLSRAEADDLFENKIWASLRNGQIDKIRAWIRELKKERFAEERDEYDKLKETTGDSGMGPDSSFEVVWETAKRAGLIDRYIAEQVRRQCAREPLENEVQAIFSNLANLPVIMSFLLHQIAYLHFVNIRSNRPKTHGNNIDARHLVAAANADIFITNDTGILDMVESSKGRWPFLAMTTDQFRRKVANWK